MRLLVELVDDFLLLTFLVFIFAFALADASTRTPVSDTASILLGRPFKLVELAIQLGARPLHCRTFVEHRFELEHGHLESPEDRVTGIANALKSHLWRETVEDGPGLSVDIAITAEDVGGLC